MLGTVGDAEDIVQEAFLRLQRELESGERIASPEAFVATVVTRLAIDELRSARARRERYVGEWLPEPLVTGSEAASVHPQPAHRAPEAGTPRRRATHPVALTMPYVAYGRMGEMVKTTVYLPDDLHRDLKQAAKERGGSEAELIRTALRHELLGAPPGQAERAQRRARLLAAMGTLDSSVYPSGYLDELRAGWRG